MSAYNGGSDLSTPDNSQNFYSASQSQSEVQNYWFYYFFKNNTAVYRNYFSNWNSVEFLG